MTHYRFALSLLSIALGFSTAALACTDIQLTAKDGTQIIARSMEFALDLKSDLVTIPRGTLFSLKTQDGKPAMTWKSKYGYLLVDGLQQVFATDGMNEQGLAFEYLYLPGETQYQAIPAGKNNQAIPYLNFGDWVLGNFKSVDEVRLALAKVYIVQVTVPAIGDMIFPLHAAIHDATGKGIVVEFVKGQMQIHDYMGVMTNSPTYQWHVANLPQYFNLSPYNPKPVVVNGVSYGSNSEGVGMVGLPGDVSPPSRFVKMAYMRQYAYQADDAAGAVNLAQHIMNNVDIAAGITRSTVDGKDTFETTEWTVFKDLTHKIFYYHTYQDMTLRSIDLNKVDFSEKSPKLVVAMATQAMPVDMTSELKAVS